MPTTYTHYRFGSDVLKQLPESYRERILAYRDLYDIGLHGPDLLFYYKALFKNPVNQLGFAMHERPGKDFFRAAKSALDPASDLVPSLAYLYGFICHFSLDSICHPYVEEQVRRTGITHSEIEAELDRALMIADGYDPITYRPTGHLKASEFNAHTIVRFFPTVTEPQIYKSIKSIRWYCNMLVAPKAYQRWVINTALKLAGSYDSIHGMIINYQPNPACVTTRTTLEHLYQQAVPLAVDLIMEYQAYLSGDRNLDERFDHTFGEE